MTVLLLLLMQSCLQAPTAENKKEKKTSSRSSNRGELLSDKLYTAITTMKSIVLDLFFFYLKWHRASLLCFWIACRNNKCIKII